MIGKKMAIRRRIFFSFHYKPDNWRASQVRNMGVVEGNTPVSDNAWETVTRGGDAAIKRWIDAQMDRKSCVIVLIGRYTSGRKWVRYEIEKAWNNGRGLVGIHVHNLRDSDRKQTVKGANPFYRFSVNGKRMSSIVNAFDPPYKRSTNVYNHIAANMADWVEEAIQIRNNYGG